MKYNFSDIVKKLIVLVVVTLGITLGLYCLIYHLGKARLDYFFDTSSYIKKAEKPYVESLQKYIDMNNISTDECERLSEWIIDNNISYFTVSKKRNLIYGVTYIDGLIMDGNASQSLHTTWQYFETIQFADDTAEVFIYASFTERYYEIIAVVAALIALISGLLFALLAIRRVIYGLQYNLEQAHIREEQLRKEKEKIVNSLAHDLRTPLTGLLTYTEIIKIENSKGKIDERHIDKVIKKAIEIKELTDQIFDFSILNSKDEIDFGGKETFASAVEDYLSDFCTVIEGKGFIVNADMVTWEAVNVAINNNFLGRIFNNIISNISKYDKMSTEIQIRTSYTTDYACIQIDNTIEKEKSALDSTGIGLDNISKMMEHMGGKFEIKEKNEIFSMTLYFPIV